MNTLKILKVLECLPLPTETAESMRRFIQDPTSWKMDYWHSSCGIEPSHTNTQANPHATFLFKEEGSGYKGKRLYLTKVREEENAELIKRLSRRNYPSDENSKEAKFLVYFKVDKERPLIGD